MARIYKKKRGDLFCSKTNFDVIADDNKEFCDLVCEYIDGQPDLKVDGVAYNGERIIELLGETTPDVLILDIIMPHLDGIEYWKNWQL